VNAVLLWKEYRQQRALWLAISVLAVLLVASLGVTIGRGTGWQVFQDDEISSTLNAAVVCAVLV
jgi:hypothetical protein